MYGRKVSLKGQIFDTEIFRDLQVFMSSESENRTFSGWYMYVTVISITKKEIAASTPNLVFYICIICRYYLKLFMKFEHKYFAQGHTKKSYTLRLMDEISW